MGYTQNHIEKKQSQYLYKKKQTKQAFLETRGKD